MSNSYRLWQRSLDVFEDDRVFIKLGNSKCNKYATIDLEDYDEVRNYSWCAAKGGKTFYARTRITKDDGSKTTIDMHNVLMGPAPQGKTIDHDNHDGFDNRRSNLSFKTDQEQNLHRMIYGAVPFHGVVPVGSRFRASININGRMKYLGTFDSPEDAARAYIAKSLEIYPNRWEYQWNGLYSEEEKNQLLERVAMGGEDLNAN